MNIALLLSDAFQRHREQPALIYREGGVDRSLSFGELEARCDAYAHGLRTFGMRGGDRVLLMERDGPRFVALTLACFKLGAVPVLIDPGMGVRNLLSCVETLRPDALVGIQKAQLLRSLYPGSFASVRRSVCTDGRWIGASPLWRIASSGRFTPVAASPDATAAILFTSGSTGPAKGVVYRHGIFWAQARALQSMFDFQPGERDMPGFPLFCLFSLSFGMTCVLPVLNSGKPASVQPERLVQAIQDWQVNNLQGSPAIWDKVGRYCRGRGIKLGSVRRVITFGAPISVDLIRCWHEVLVSGDLYTPYGATEALPVSSISGREVLEETSRNAREGGGVCVGTPVLEVRILKISDDAIPEWREELVLPAGQVGEIVVSGDQVTWAYDQQPEATRQSKIIQGDRLWHRMGDLGYLDTQGRLWVVGRKAHRIQGRDHQYFPVCAEAMVDEHPSVRRSALVGVGPLNDQQPVLIVEPWSSRLLNDPAEQNKLSRELRELLSKHPVYGDVKTVLYRDSFPVDARHNAKIHREELAGWAAEQLKPV